MPILVLSNPTAMMINTYYISKLIGNGSSAIFFFGTLKIKPFLNDLSASLHYKRQVINDGML